jgi:hypothetical protein
MKLKMDDSSVAQLFILVSSVSQVKADIEKNEAELLKIETRIKELRAADNAVEFEVGCRATLLKQGSMDGLRQLLELQWKQEQAAKDISDKEVAKAAVLATLSVLDEALLGYQKQIDATLQGRKV